MKIQHLFIYPIKSLRGVEKKSWQAKQSGFAFDRHWMLVDENLTFLTLRELPDLRLFSVDLDEAAIHVQRNDEKLSWEISSAERKVIETKVWDDVAKVRRVEGKINQFFSDYLSKKVSLVKLVDENARLHFAGQLNKNIPVSLADGYPYLVVGTASLDHLNERLETPISFHRFRPNIVVDTIHPHEEDRFLGLKGANTQFTNIKPCARCQVINLDLETGTFQKEPLKALSGYRKVENKVLFGTNMTCLKEGRVEIGETLFKVM